MTVRIGIVVGSTRLGRFADKPAAWITEIARRRGEIEIEVLDLRDYPLPLFEEARAPIYVPAVHPGAVRWAAKLAEIDGFIVVAAEYNHGPTAVLKNALDHAYPEFNRKPVAFVGYGGVGGARAVEHLRLVCIELQMAPTRTAVHIGGADFVGALVHGKPLAELPHLGATADAMLDELLWWTRTLKAGREEGQAA